MRRGASARVAMGEGTRRWWARAVALAAALLGLASAGEARAEVGDDWVGVGGQLGLFGLFNVDGELTHGELAFAVLPAYDHDVTRVLSVGGELLAGWVRSERGEDHHLILSPMLRGRLRFPLAEDVEVELLLALGLTWWEGTDAEAALSPAFAEARFGWSLRAGGGIAYHLDGRWALTLDAGYGMSSTWTDDLPITIDGFVITLGPRVRL
ncbi:MAG: hypothetical protein EP329_23730 [Deltaproteobacteria bacterium]|nr:MAG: hypothetical protein EP329_23730 [Deltaproteobacteria bacterium]